MADANPNNFWEAFGDSSEFDMYKVTCQTSDNLAKEVLETFGIQCGTDNIGGSLDNLDIKRMDAMQVVRLSLLEASANTGKIYEPIMSSEGVMEFIEIGSFNGLSGADVYYELQTGTYREYCGGVMVTGTKPLAYRRPVEWHPIWQNGPKDIYDTGMMMNNCIQGDFNQQATIVFNNPHLDSRYEDGIDNLYEITRNNPYDSIIGYASYIYFDGYEKSPDTVITYQESAKIIIKLPDKKLGQFFKRPKIADIEDLIDAGCMEGQDKGIDDPTLGVPVPIPENLRFESVKGTTVDKFNSVLDVMVIGLEIDHLRPIPVNKADALNPTPNPENIKLEASINKTHKQLYKLSKGAHYVVGYDGMATGKIQPYIVFADNSRSTDLIKLDGNNPTQFRLSPECDYAVKNDLNESSGYILITGPNSGILVEEIHVSVLIDSPSIEVYDPDGWNRKARSIAESLQYLVAPLIVVEEPNPIAFNGQLIDQTQGIRDHDPTTAQSFTDTDLEKAMDLMSGNGITLSLTFLNAEQCVKLSDALFDYMNSGDGTESTYICGPETEVRLGGTAPNGGIVNSINYSYQDSNSYTISVNAGPVIMGNFAQVDGGPSQKMMEEVSAKGTIIEDMGNHIHFKVRIDGIGDRIAINMCPSILRVGDKVQCSVHNNPVEI